MPSTDVSVTSFIVTSGGSVTVPLGGAPAPMPTIAPGEPHPGGRIRTVVGTEGDDTLAIEGGATAIGGGGDDVFVLVSSGVAGEESERLGVILDYDISNDALDLGKIGEDAVILTHDAIKGGARIGIDYDGDGDEDGYVLAYAPGPDGQPATLTPDDDDGGFVIQPFPIPTDDGLFTILPYPMPTDGEITLSQAFEAGVAIRALDGWSV